MVTPLYVDEDWQLPALALYSTIGTSCVNPASSWWTFTSYSLPVLPGARPCCTDRPLASGAGRRREAAPSLTLAPRRAVQSQSGVSPPHSEAAASGDQLGRV